MRAAVSAPARAEGRGWGGPAGGLHPGCLGQFCLSWGPPAEAAGAPVPRQSRAQAQEALKAWGLGAQGSCLSVRWIFINSSSAGRGPLLPSNQKWNFSSCEKPVLGRRSGWGAGLQAASLSSRVTRSQASFDKSS